LPKKIKRLIEFTKTPFGRKDLSKTLVNSLYPATRPFAALYRRTVLRRVKIISVIGSLGKSTTCRAIADVVGDARLSGFSNYKNSIVRNMLKHGPSSKYAVLETAVGGPGYMAGYASMLDPDIVAVTSIASEHILTFGSLENTREEKVKMLRYLSPDKIAVVNADDPNVMWMAGQTRARIITFGIDKPADVRARNIHILPAGGMDFEAVIKGESYPMTTPLLGRHTLYAPLAALAVAWSEGLDLNASCSILQQQRPLEARMESVTLPSGALLVRDDYKATRESVWRALETLADLPARRRILVLGGVSEISNKERYPFFKDLGTRIGRSADYAYLYLQRNQFKRCRSGAVDSGMDQEKVFRIKSDPISIRHQLPEDLGPGDVVLVKGRTDYKISRLSLVLMGRKVKCRIMACSVTTSCCDDCAMLESGWKNDPFTGSPVNKTQ